MMQSLPVLYITATNNYDVGNAIGTTFRSFIDDYVKTSKDVDLFRKFYHSVEGRGIYDEYLNNSRKYFPDITDEIQGIADGAGQSFTDIFLLQLASEIRLSHQHEIPELHVEEPPKEDKGCTDLLINTKHLRMIAHNDDWSDEVSERVYIGHVTITNGGENETFIRERFLSYMYLGYLAGFCFGMNKDLVITLNTVRPITANRSGIPLAILLRKLFSCSTIQECSDVMQNEPLGCAFGMNINIAHVHDESMCSLEVYPEESKTRVDIVNVKDHHYCHTNHYKHIDSIKEAPTDGSFIRHRRAEEMTSRAPSCDDDVRRILGDTNDEREPICRVPDEKYILKHSKTSATAVFDIRKRRLDVYRSNPKHASGPCFSTCFI